MLEKDVAVRDGDDAITFKQLEAEREKLPKKMRTSKKLKVKRPKVTDESDRR
ncbi:hypothetical protein [Enterobacter phage 04_vB_Eclo_IJM]|nr:hypothetical protein [Enterobacter phage 04_vB_Eclo_IJM]